MQAVSCDLEEGRFMSHRGEVGRVHHSIGHVSCPSVLK